MGVERGEESEAETETETATNMETWADNYEEYDNYEGYDEKPCSVCAVPGLAPVLEIKGIENGTEKTFKISQYKGRYLVVVFYRGDWKCGEVVEEFSNIKSQLASNGADVVCVSSDSTDTHAAWIKADKSKGGLGGSLGIPLWSDPSGELANSFDLYDQEEKHCLDGFVIIDDVFKLTYDDWMAVPGAKKWSEGQGVFVNNYSNFLLWVNLEDQLRLVSVSKGQDLKYVL